MKEKQANESNLLAQLKQLEDLKRQRQHEGENKALTERAGSTMGLRRPSGERSLSCRKRSLKSNQKNIGSPGKREEKIEDRLLELGRQNREWQQRERARKDAFELKEVTGKPVISEVSERIIQSKGANFVSSFEMANSLRIQFERDRQRETQRLQQLAEREVSEVTAHPKINEHSREIKRDLADLYRWQIEKERRNMEKRQVKENLESEFIASLGKVEIVSKQSLDILERSRC